jgi:hypothetical protein
MLHLTKSAMSRIHVSPGNHHYHALYRDSKRRVEVIATKRTGEQWECVVFRQGVVQGMFRLTRCSENTVLQGVKEVLEQSSAAA